MTGPYGFVPPSDVRRIRSHIALAWKYSARSMNPMLYRAGSRFKSGTCWTSSLYPFLPNPKTVMSRNDPSSSFRKGQETYELTSPGSGSWWLTQTNPTGVSLAPKQTQGTTCDQA